MPVNRTRQLFLLVGMCFIAQYFAHWTTRGVDAAQPQPVDRTGKPWTREEARAHADRYNDLALMNTKFLKNDSTSDQAQTADRVSYPFSRLAFNTPNYELTGREMPGLASSPIPVAKPMAGVLVGVHEKLALKDVPAGKGWHEVVRTEPVLAIVASGPTVVSDQGNIIVSRSHPHYFFQGALSSKQGEIRWVAVRMADGTELAIVNGRVLDLSQGNLILVRQHEDGSIRIHQHLARLQPARGEELRQSIPTVLKQPELQRVLGDGN